MLVKKNDVKLKLIKVRISIHGVVHLHQLDESTHYSREVGTKFQLGL